MNFRHISRALLAVLSSAVFVGSWLLSLTAAAQELQRVAVRHIQGTSHAFLVIRAESGAVLGYG